MEIAKSYAAKTAAVTTGALKGDALKADVLQVPAIGASDKRRSRRRAVNRSAKLKFNSQTPPRECIITDISTGGVRLHVEGFEVPDEFVLLDSRDGYAAEFCYRVVWRQGHEVGACFVGRMPRRPGASRG